jgi:hypothetical protein
MWTIATEKSKMETERRLLGEVGVKTQKYR